MTYLYHIVPDRMEGGILYPLNVLKEKYPETHKDEVAKYAGREHIMEQRIPTLHCLWNDVLHMSAVSPQEIRNALVEAGRINGRPLSYYRVDPMALDPSRTTIYRYAHQNRERSMSPENFAPYEPEKIEKYATMPQETKDYYKEIIEKGSHPLLYHKIPHILYKGSIDVTGLPIITV